jgi:hypothetical protein
MGEAHPAPTERIELADATTRRRGSCELGRPSICKPSVLHASSPALGLQRSAVRNWIPGRLLFCHPAISCGTSAWATSQSRESPALGERSATRAIVRVRTRFDARTRLSAQRPAVLLCAERAHGPPEFVAGKLDEPVLADRRNVASRKATTTPPAHWLPESDKRGHELSGKAGGARLPTWQTDRRGRVAACDCVHAIAQVSPDHSGAAFCLRRVGRAAAESSP